MLLLSMLLLSVASACCVIHSRKLSSTHYLAHLRLHQVESRVHNPNSLLVRPSSHQSDPPCLTATTSPTMRLGPRSKRLI